MLCRVFALALLLAGLSSCSQTPDIFQSGQDSRTFNAATGRYEWPERK